MICVFFHIVTVSGVGHGVVPLRSGAHGGRGSLPEAPRQLSPQGEQAHGGLVDGGLEVTHRHCCSRRGVDCYMEGGVLCGELRSVGEKSIVKNIKLILRFSKI
jgi:hypothetical protein